MAIYFPVTIAGSYMNLMMTNHLAQKSHFSKINKLTVCKNTLHAMPLVVKVIHHNSQNQTAQ